MYTKKQKKWLMIICFSLLYLQTTNISVHSSLFPYTLTDNYNYLIPVIILRQLLFLFIVCSRNFKHDLLYHHSNYER